MAYVSDVAELRKRLIDHKLKAGLSINTMARRFEIDAKTLREFLAGTYRRTKTGTIARLELALKRASVNA